MEENFRIKLEQEGATFSFGVDRFLEEHPNGITSYFDRRIVREGSQEYTLSEKDINRLEKKGVIEKKGKVTPYRYERTEYQQGGPDDYGEYGGKGKNNLAVVDMEDKLGVVATYEITEAAHWRFVHAIDVAGLKINGQALYPKGTVIRRKEIEGKKVLPLREDENGNRSETHELMEYGIYDENGIREATPKEVRAMAIILKEKGVKLFGRDVIVPPEIVEEAQIEGPTMEEINQKYGKEAENKIIAGKEAKREAEQKRIEQEKKEAKMQQDRQAELKKAEDFDTLSSKGATLEPKFEELVKECLLGEDDRLEQMCWLETSGISENDRINPFANAPELSKPISVREALLIKLGVTSIPRAERSYIGGPEHDSAYYDVKIDDTGKLTDRQEAQVTLAKDRKEELKMMADKLTDADLDEKGEITFRCNDYPMTQDTTLETVLSSAHGEIPYKEKWTHGDVEKLGFTPDYAKGSWTTKETMTVTMTKRELIKAGLDPELLGWHSLERQQEEIKAKVEPKDIILAEQKASFPKKVIDGIKGFFDKLHAKGKDEVER